MHPVTPHRMTRTAFFFCVTGVESRCKMNTFQSKWPRLEQPIIGVLETYFPLDDEEDDDDENL